VVQLLRRGLVWRAIAAVRADAALIDDIANSDYAAIGTGLVV